MTGHWTRRLRRGFSALAAGAVAFTAGVGVLPAASAGPTPVTPTDPLASEQWVNPAVRPGEADSGVTLELAAAPGLQVAPLRPGGNLVVELRIRNDSGASTEALSLVARRGEAVPGSARARDVLAADTSLYGYYGAIEEIEALAPGEERTLRLSLPTLPGEDGSLSISAPGAYPVMFTLGDSSGLLTTERTLIPVTGDAGAPEEPAEPEPEERPGFSLIYPVTAPVDIVPGETGTAPEQPPLLLRSEELADQLAEGGRLTQLVDAYASATDADPELGYASCLALDPALVDVVDRMSRGYTVTPERSTQKVPQRLRDSWFRNEEEIPSEPGRGAEDAAEWIGDLVAVAEQGCVVALPWANTDLRAVAATGDTWLMREAVERGPFTLERILGTAGTTNAVVMPGGYVTPETYPALAWADHEQSGLAEGGMSAQWEAAQTAGGEAAYDPGGPVRVLVADNTVAGEGVVRDLGAGIRAVTYQSSLATLLAATGAEPTTTGYSNTATRYDYRVDSPVSRTITAGAALRAELTQAEDVVVAMLPEELDPETARHLLNVGGAVLADDSARPLPFGELLAQPATPTAPDAFVGAPFPDPSVTSDTEIAAARDHGTYLNDLTRIMVNEPTIALTRYGFTHPMRQELLLALAGHGRSSLGGYDSAVRRTADRLGALRGTLQAMRSSVSLIPPGNVYTRASQSSPLLIVAENGLPLPVKVAVNFYSEDEVTLHVATPLRIPARGSMTVEMTADLPARHDQTDIRLWLATQDGAAVSAPVDISVQTRAGSASLLVLLGALAAVLAIAFVARRSRTRRQATSAASKPTARGPDPGPDPASPDPHEPPVL
ncbi:hypothetical protein [Corynebacterium guangdongense]|uniref:DNA-directed RNA polymerase subunit L n=1 Tax=Corynebacterium guangdongense TaxID=1783348 RepID=A0ABU2A268_9CORY|nr:hypothetical protein [Corynebacterium guangdongense]MDR7330582.1 DNA-directed RNA polymerase subunit L [Corynebacterium guangdongense]WJZ19136.1 hypothetical protein CGUA_13045 [Corynebacterium guangdongense]